MILNTRLECKPTDFKVTACDVKKVIELSKDEFEDFLKKPLEYHDYFEEFNKEGYEYSNEKMPCLLILGEGSEDGICVDTQGYRYARYASYIPHARQILEAEMSENEDTVVDGTLSDNTDFEITM